MFFFLIFSLLASISVAIPVVEHSNVNHQKAEPFKKRAAFPGQLAVLSGASIFARQGCPSLSLLCPGGICCSYASEVTSCCGRDCCASGYLCTGGTIDEPCCVAISSSTNTCGAVDTNPCITPGYLPCSGANFCCPPDSICYFDNFNVPRCSPNSTPSPSSSSRSSPITTTTSRTTSQSTSSSYSFSSTSYSSSRSTQPTPTPVDSDEDTFNEETIEEDNVFPPTRSQYIPWSWYVHSSDPNATCPSAGRTLATFAAVNVVVTVFSMILCHRKVTKWWSFGLFGGRESEMWKLTWMIPLGLQLGANAIIASIYKTTPGYSTGFEVYHLFLFWTTRPRLSWIVLAAFINIGATDDKNGHWEAAAKSSMIAELILFLMSTYYMGLTANFARINGFYSLRSTAPQSAQLFYAGALMSLIFGFVVILYLVAMIGIKHSWRSQGYTFWGLLVISTTTWLASWLFWVGYIFTAGETYCPPKLATSGAIWSIFSIFGNILGGGGA